VTAHPPASAGDARASEPFFLTGHREADELLAVDPLALIVGMLLDQQVAIEWAFAAPATLRTRLGDGWGAAAIATQPVDHIVGVFCAKPALHRFPAAMARRTHALCEIVVDTYGGDVSRIWADVASGADLVRRLRALPGFGPEKAKIFVALLAKRFGVRPAGWQEACAPFGDGEPRTVADITSPETLAAVRAWKRATKAAGRSKSD
jgi:uncharacterized HhH-GPD family protein